MEIGNVLGHHTSRTNCHPSADGDPWQNDNITSKPAIFSNIDRFPQLWTFDSISKEWIKRVGTTVERAIRTNEGTGSNCDQASVEEGSVEVNVNTFADSTRISN